jgi:hypothetical protein
MKKLLSLFFCLFFLASFIQSQTTLSTGNGDFPAGSSTTWEVPEHVYSILVNTTGAGGGDAMGEDGLATGGLGASVGAQFDVTPGHMLNIVVGVQGGMGGVVSFQQNTTGDGGGGGGTAIYNVTTGQLLIAAGGGGGAHGDFATGMNRDGGDALAPSILVMPNGGAGTLGAGGGGADNPGAIGSDGATGGIAGTPAGGAGGAGGTVNTNGGTGGFGYGGGGGGHQNSGGGGGGTFGGDGGAGGNGGIDREGKGGGSHIEGSGMAVNFALAASPADGSAEITFEVTVIPTMGQWGLIALAMFMFIIGVVALKDVMAFRLESK